MSHNHPRRPAWLRLYLLIAICLAAFLIELKLFPSESAHRAIELGNILLIYSLVWMWLKANEGGLMWEELHRTQPDQTDPAAPEPSAGGFWSWQGWRLARRLAWLLVIPALAVVLSSVLALPLQARATLLGLGLAWLPLSRMIEVS